MNSYYLIVCRVSVLPSHLLLCPSSSHTTYLDTETLVIAVEKDGKVTPSDVGEKFYRHRSEEEKEEE